MRPTILVYKSLSLTISLVARKTTAERYSEQLNVAVDVVAMSLCRLCPDRDTAATSIVTRDRVRNNLWY